MSKKNRPTIGRTLNPSILSGFDSSSASGDRVEQVFKLSTGRQATFIEEVIPPNQVESDTFVDQHNNGRDQASLTPKSLKSIRSTIKHQQFYPAIGVRRATGKIEILDGSRRRASAILENVGLRVLVTDQGPATACRIIDNDSPVIFGMKILRAFIYINRISSPPAIRIYPLPFPFILRLRNHNPFRSQCPGVFHAGNIDALCFTAYPPIRPPGP